MFLRLFPLIIITIIPSFLLTPCKTPLNLISARVTVYLIQFFFFFVIVGHLLCLQFLPKYWLISGRFIVKINQHRKQNGENVTLIAIVPPQDLVSHYVPKTTYVNKQLCELFIFVSGKINPNCWQHLFFDQTVYQENMN